MAGRGHGARPAGQRRPGAGHGAALLGDVRQQAGGQPDHHVLQRRGHDGSRQPRAADIGSVRRPSERSTRHLEIALPAGVTYQTGDHLGIVPRNGLDQIRRVLLRFKLDAGLYLTITPNTNASTHLPVNEPVPLLGVLANRVELQDVATRAQLATLAEYAQDSAQRDALLALAGDDDASQARYREQVLMPRKSILDLLDEFPSCALPFEAYLDLLPPLRPRYYSISSSPLVAADTCSITVGVVEAPARSGHGVFNGVVLELSGGGSRVDATVYGFIHQPTMPFHPPDNPHLPMIMVGPGTGVAPFRGFLQERAALKQRGVPVGESMLFFGCRDPLQDFLYEDELRAFEAAGVTRLLRSVLARARQAEDLRAAGDPGAERGRVAAAPAGGGDLRLRRRGPHGAGRPGGLRRRVPRATPAPRQPTRRPGSPDCVASHRYLEDIWASAT